MIRKFTFSLVIVMLTVSQGVWAENWTDKVSISGFGSAIYRISDQSVPFNGHVEESGIDEDGAFQGTRMGLNVNATVADRITVASQFIASREEENYVAHIDWGFISYQASANWALRSGKIKFPGGIVNEYIDVGLAYPWIAPPILFYTEESSGPQATREAYTGFSSYWTQEIDDWALSADLFYGDVSLESMLLTRQIFM